MGLNPSKSQGNSQRPGEWETTKNFKQDWGMCAKVVVVLFVEKEGEILTENT